MELTRLLMRLFFIIIFIIAAINQFYIGNQTNGILWLILAQLYDNEIRNNKN